MSRRRSLTAPPPGYGLGLAPQQGKNCLGSGVGLSHGSHTGLLQYLGLGEVRGFGGDVGITDARFGSAEVGNLGLCQTDSVVQLVLALTDRGLGATQFLHRFTESDHRLRSAFLAADVDG